MHPYTCWLIALSVNSSETGSLLLPPNPLHPQLMQCLIKGCQGCLPKKGEQLYFCRKNFMKLDKLVALSKKRKKTNKQKQ